MTARACLASSWLLLAALGAQDAKPPVRGDTLRHAAVVLAPAAQVYAAFTTAEGVQRAWGVAQAKVDFRIGGSIRTAYDAKIDLDGPDAIVNTILAFEPERMVVVKSSAPQNAPAFIQEICKTSWTVIRFEPLAPDRTRVAIAMLGFGTGPLYDEAWRHFDRGNAYTLVKMQQGLGDPKAAAAVAAVRRAQERVEALCGGEWLGELVGKDGKPSVARTVWKMRLEDHFVIAEGWLGAAGDLREHGHMAIGPDPESGGLGFWNFGDQGDVTRGHVRLLGDDRLALDWNSATQGGKRASYHVQLVLESADSYRMLLHASEAAARTEPPLADVLYRRRQAADPTRR